MVDGIPIVDSHAHIFPYLGGPAGFRGPEVHLMYVQRAMHTHASQPGRARGTNELRPDKGLWDSDDPTLAGRRQVAFRAERNGRFGWTLAGEDRFLQFMPPGLQHMEASPEYLVAEMDYAGIDVAVLQNDHIYGRLDEYFAQAALEYPDRFVGLAQVEEAFGYRNDQIERLEHSVLGLGMRGLYFSTANFFLTNGKPEFDDSDFDPLWQTVQRLGIPVFWVLRPVTPGVSFEEYFRRFVRWLERFPDVKSLITHGFPDAAFMRDFDANSFELPVWIVEAVMAHDVSLELLFPIKWGGRWSYPYPQANTLLEAYYQSFGANRLVWGSDMPNVGRYCTYAQSLRHALENVPYMSEREKRQVFGENTMNMLRIDPSMRHGETR